MAEEPRFDIGAIARASGIIIGVTAVFGFVIPAVATLLFDPTSSHTGPAASSVIFTLGYWAVSWGLTIWQGAWMVREVHDRIVDDMLVTAILVAVVLLILKIMISLIYEAESIFGSFDVGGALVLLIVAVVGSRANQF